jgi:hypothetical protein
MSDIDRCPKVAMGMNFTTIRGENLRFYTKSECDRLQGEYNPSPDAPGRGECFANDGFSYAWHCRDTPLPVDSIYSYFGGGGSTESSMNLVVPAIGLVLLIILLKR